jgi:hypothetical protein
MTTVGPLLLRRRREIEEDRWFPQAKCHASDTGRSAKGSRGRHSTRFENEFWASIGIESCRAFLPARG